MRSLTMVVVALLIVCVDVSDLLAACGCNTGSCTYCETDSENSGTFGYSGITSNAYIWPITNFCAENEALHVDTSQDCPAVGYCNAQYEIWDERPDPDILLYRSNVCNGPSCSWDYGSLPIRGEYARIVVSVGHETGLTTSVGIEHTLLPPGDQCCTDTPGVRACNSCIACDFDTGCGACMVGASCSGGSCGGCAENDSGVCGCY